MSKKKKNRKAVGITPSKEVACLAEPDPKSSEDKVLVNIGQRVSDIDLEQKTVAYKEAQRGGNANQVNKEKSSDLKVAQKSL